MTIDTNHKTKSENNKKQKSKKKSYTSPQSTDHRSGDTGKVYRRKSPAVDMNASVVDAVINDDVNESENHPQPRSCWMWNIKCDFWPNCRNGAECPYRHPSDKGSVIRRRRQTPKEGDSKGRPILCKFGKDCIRNDCWFWHPGDDESFVELSDMHYQMEGVNTEDEYTTDTNPEKETPNDVRSTAIVLTRKSISNPWKRKKKIKDKKQTKVESAKIDECDISPLTNLNINNLNGNPQSIRSAPLLMYGNAIQHNTHANEQQILQTRAENYFIMNSSMDMNTISRSEQLPMLHHQQQQMSFNNYGFQSGLNPRASTFRYSSPVNYVQSSAVAPVPVRPPIRNTEGMLLCVLCFCIIILLSSLHKY